MENRLVNVPQGDNFTDLQKISEEEYNTSLRNLITGTTPKEDFPGNVIPQRPLARGVSVDYVPGWWFIKQLNSLFGHFWDFEIINQDIGREQIWVLGKLTVKDPKTGLTVTKTAYGGSKIKSSGNPGIDIGDDLKSAATDALKKAATLFGFAADVYGRREMLEEVSPVKKQLDNVYKIGTAKSMSKEQVDDFCLTTMKKDINELTEVELLTLMGKVRSS